MLALQLRYNALDEPVMTIVMSFLYSLPLELACSHTGSTGLKGSPSSTMPVVKNARSDGALRTTMPNFPDNPEIPMLSASRVHDVPYIQIPNDHYPNPGKCEKSRAMFLKE